MRFIRANRSEFYTNNYVVFIAARKALSSSETVKRLLGWARRYKPYAKAHLCYVIRTLPVLLKYTIVIPNRSCLHQPPHNSCQVISLHENEVGFDGSSPFKKGSPYVYLTYRLIPRI